MNGDPYRTPQPADRRVINRSGQAYQRPDEPQQIVKEEPPRPVAPRASTGSGRSSRVEKDRKENKGGLKGLLWTFIIIALIAVAVIVGWVVWSNSKAGDEGIDTGRYQAVYLMNGQIYFGKLGVLNDTKMRLTDVYYLQTQSSTADGTEESTASAEAAGSFQLIKLSRAIYGPSDEMIISKDQILYYQNLEPNSRAADLIKNDR